MDTPMKMALIALVLLIVGAGLIMYRMKNHTMKDSVKVEWFKTPMGIIGLVAIALGVCMGSYGIYAKMTTPSYAGLPFVRGM
jgi:hypothetical protein